MAKQREAREPSTALSLAASYFMLVGALGIVGVVGGIIAGLAGVYDDGLAAIRQHPIGAAVVFVTYPALILTGWNLNRRRRSAGIAAIGLFVLQIADQIARTSLSWWGLFASLFGVLFIASVWDELE